MNYLVNSPKSSQEYSAVKSILKSLQGITNKFFGVWERTVNEIMKWTFFKSLVSGSIPVHKHTCFNYRVIVRDAIYISVALSCPMKTWVLQCRV